MLSKSCSGMHVLRRQRLGQAAVHAAGLRPHALCEWPSAVGVTTVWALVCWTTVDAPFTCVQAILH